ncbi:MAG: LolA-like putative outer membrane lipoprotein chaperone [Bacteroidales bacterium]
MKIFSLSLWLLLLPIFCAGAQNNQKAIELLEKSAQVFKANTGIEASFLLKDGMNDPKNLHSFEGVLKSKQSRFMIDLPEIRTWFDGKTQWSYLKSNREVNITSPTEEEIAAVNPVALLRLYQNGYRAVYKGERTIKGEKVAEIELLAERKDSPLRKIFVRLNMANYLPVSVLIRDKNGNSSEVTFLKIKQNLNLPDSDFVFNKKEFPEAEVIDLR